MLNKLLKYDMKSIGRFWWIIAASDIAISFVGAIALRVLLSDIYNSSLNIFMTIMMAFVVIISIVGIIAAFLATQILIFIRFYKHFFSDEGYLTFTLPVSRKKLLLSKTINAMFWTTLSYILLIVTIFLFMLISPPTFEGELLNTDLIVAIGQIFSALTEAIGLWMIVYVIEILLIFALMTLFAITLIHFCITVGAVVAKKLKWLVAIGIYYVTNIVLSGAGQLIAFISIFIMTDGFVTYLSNASMNVILSSVALIGLIICAMTAAVTAIMYFITLGTIERKLNLA